MNQHESIKIALIDGQAGFRRRIGHLLEKAGFHVLIQAENGFIALELLQTAHPLPDVCITEVAMPEKDGYETIKRLRQQYPAIKILGYGIDADALVIMKMLQCGAHGFTTKSIYIQELQEAISRIYYDGVYFNTASGKTLLEQLRKNY
jgi:two-component system invasion response regulator UvrY